MTPAPLACPKCRADLKDVHSSPGDKKACPGCDRPLEVIIFPALYRSPLVGKSAETLVAAEDAGCFYHPQSRAQVPCDSCGRFLCALCDVELQGQHLCPACISTWCKKKQIHSFDDGRVLYGGLASILALLPLLMWPLTIITGPLSVFIALYGWNKPQSVTTSNRLSFIVAIIFGGAETIAWVFLGAKVFKLI